MNSEKMYEAITEIREEFIIEAKGHTLKKPRKRILQWCAVAASFLLIIGIGGYWFMLGRPLPAPGGNMGGGGRAEGSTTFLSYAGPVFPLSVSDDAEGLAASRHTHFDFDSNLPHPTDIMITDSFILTNNTAADKMITAVYPFAGNFAELEKLRPMITAGGTPLETNLVAGIYSGGFTSVSADYEIEGANLRYINSWEGYAALLSCGGYLQRALGDAPVLDQPVTVYAFSNVRADHKQSPAATLAASFYLDFNRTAVLTYNFNGTMYDMANGFMRRSFFVPREIDPRFDNSFYMIVIGDDIQDMVIQGYENGGCHAGEEVDHVTATVVRYEAVLGDVLMRLFDEYMAVHHNDKNLDMAMLHRAMTELLLDYGLLAENVAFRYSTGEMLDIFHETLVMDRVFYLTAEVTVPAGESVEIIATMVKPASFDFYGSGSGNMGVSGYDMMTRLGSSLMFGGMTAAISGVERIVIVNQNFGFDPDNGIVHVSLDMEQPHYYLEVRHAGD